MLLKLFVGRLPDGMYKSWSRDAQHRSESEFLGVFRDTWRDRGGRLHWRLTPEEIDKLDQMTADCIWPHYADRLHYDGASFWRKSSRIYKTKRKMRLFYYLLPTLLEDVLPIVRHPLFKFIWCMRRLEGQVFCYEEALRLGILPGSFTVAKAGLDIIHSEIVCALVLLEGCLPLSHLNPGLHHFVHYAEFVRSHGPLRNYWMMCFER